MSSKNLMRQAQRVAEAASARKIDHTRHKCFVSYHVNDIDEVETFLDDFGTEFIPRSVGVTIEDDFVDSTDDDYIKTRIRELYLSDSTVTIVLLGTCAGVLTMLSIGRYLRLSETIQSTGEMDYWCTRCRR